MGNIVNIQLIICKHHGLNDIENDNIFIFNNI